jgi:hypothetical protein
MVLGFVVASLGVILFVVRGKQAALTESPSE